MLFFPSSECPFEAQLFDLSQHASFFLLFSVVRSRTRWGARTYARPRRPPSLSGNVSQRVFAHFTLICQPSQGQTQAAGVQPQVERGTLWCSHRALSFASFVPLPFFLSRSLTARACRPYRNQLVRRIMQPSQKCRLWSIGELITSVFSLCLCLSSLLHLCGNHTQWHKKERKPRWARPLKGLGPSTLTPSTNNCIV